MFRYWNRAGFLITDDQTFFHTLILVSALHLEAGVASDIHISFVFTHRITKLLVAEV